MATKLTKRAEVDLLFRTLELIDPLPAATRLKLTYDLMALPILTLRTIRNRMEHVVALALTVGKKIGVDGDVAYAERFDEQCMRDMCEERTEGVLLPPAGVSAIRDNDGGCSEDLQSTPQEAEHVR